MYRIPTQAHPVRRLCRLLLPLLLIVSGWLGLAIRVASSQTLDARGVLKGEREMPVMPGDRATADHCADTGAAALVEAPLALTVAKGVDRSYRMQEQRTQIEARRAELTGQRPQMAFDSLRAYEALKVESSRL